MEMASYALRDVCVYDDSKQASVSYDSEQKRAGKPILEFVLHGFICRLSTEAIIYHPADPPFTINVSMTCPPTNAFTETTPVGTLSSCMTPWQIVYPSVRFATLATLTSFSTILGASVPLWACGAATLTVKALHAWAELAIVALTVRPESVVRLGTTKFWPWIAKDCVLIPEPEIEKVFALRTVSPVSENGK